MPTARAKKEKEPPGPDDLVRAGAGAYRSGDGRFEVQKSDVGWYIVDTEQANEFGQQLIHGPMATLEAIRAAIPGARDIKPLLRVRPTASAKTSAKSSAKAKEPPRPPSPPETWIDRLPDKEAHAVRQLIKALDKEGLQDADGLVKRHRDDVAPTIATRLVEQRLRALIDEQPEADRERAQELVARAARILADGGNTIPAPAPRWALVEVNPDDDQPKRRITPRL